MEAIEQLKSIYWKAVRAVEPFKLVKESLQLSGDHLEIKGEETKSSEDINEYQEIIVLGAGKATYKMAEAVEEILGERISKGLISVPRKNSGDFDYIKVIEGGHPTPNEGSLKAGREVRKIAQNAGKKSLVINLLSGGGSSLLVNPLEFQGNAGDNISLEQLSEMNKILINSGAGIKEINAVRKHVSSIKGGRLANLLFPARTISLIISDVVGDRLDSIASGLTAPDETTYSKALSVIDKYSIRKKLPQNILEVIETGCTGEIEETGRAGDKSFNRIDNIIIGNNFKALKAASEEGERFGYNSIILSSHVTGESREVAKVITSIGIDNNKRKLISNKPVCVISGGETTVTIRGDGKGGRNQELALSFLKELEKADAGENIYFLSAATDGIDGPTDAAGGFAYGDAIDKEMYAKIDEYLRDNDSYNFLARSGLLFKPGATKTNVGDIHLLLIK